MRISEHVSTNALMLQVRRLAEGLPNDQLVSRRRRSPDRSLRQMTKARTMMDTGDAPLPMVESAFMPVHTVIVILSPVLHPLMCMQCSQRPS